jgi:hypothetical protein
MILSTVLGVAILGQAWLGQYEIIESSSGNICKLIVVL